MEVVIPKSLEALVRRCIIRPMGSITGHLLRPRPALFITVVFLALLIDARVADACVCGERQSFAQVAASRPLAVVARVETLGPTVKGFFADGNPAFADVEVLWIGKGSVNAPRIRIWDAGVGAECGWRFRETPAGTYVVFALTPASTGVWGYQTVWKPDSQIVELVPTGWKPRHVPEEVLKAGLQGPVASDYDVHAVCEEAFLVLKTPEELAQYVGKKIP